MGLNIKGAQAMTNEERALQLFYNQYPQFKQDRAALRLNIFGDVIDPRRPEGSRVIAKSDCKHDLSVMRYDLPTTWEIIDR